MSCCFGHDGWRGSGARRQGAAGGGVKMCAWGVEEGEGGRRRLQEGGRCVLMEVREGEKEECVCIIVM